MDLGQGTVEKRGKNTYRLRVSITYSNGSKKRLDKTVHCRTKSEANKALDAWRLELLKDSDKAFRSDMTLNEYLQSYLLYCRDEKELSPSTIRGYRDVIRTRFDGEFGKTKLCDLQPHLIEEHYSYLRREGGANGRPISGSSVRKAHSILKAALKRAVRLALIPHNPCDLVDGPSVKKPKTESLSLEETNRMLLLLRGHPDKRFAMATTLALSTGMRRGEICGLRWKDVDLDGNEIHVAHSLIEAAQEDGKTGKRLSLKEPKTESSDRHISIDGSLVKQLKRYKEDQYYLLRYFDTDQTPLTPVLCDNLGSWYIPDHFTKDFEAFKQQHNFDVRLHDLRHTHASILLQNGIDVLTVAHRLGHAKPSTTQDIYGHVLPGKDQEAANCIDDLFHYPAA